MAACILTLLVFYPITIAAGYGFYRYIQKSKPNPIAQTDPRYRFIRPWRFVMFVVLLPLALTGSLAVLGILDPLFYLIASFY